MRGRSSGGFRQMHMVHASHHQFLQANRKLKTKPQLGGHVNEIYPHSPVSLHKARCTLQDASKSIIPPHKDYWCFLSNGLAFHYEILQIY